MVEKENEEPKNLIKIESVNIVRKMIDAQKN